MLLTLLIFGLLPAALSLDRDLYHAGEKQYETILADSRHPKYGPCWTTVLEEVRVGCRRLTEDGQHRLALGFTNCFLAKTGRPTYDGCGSNDEEISSCVRDMDASAFGAYTNFFSHAQSLCYFLENIRWQENAEVTINRLIQQTRLFEERLHDWNSSILSFEQVTSSLQASLVDAGSRLTDTFDQSQAAVAVMRQASADQHAIIRDVFKQLTLLQESVVDEFAGFYAYAYYVASTGLAYVLTSTQRTDSARMPLLAVTSATFAVERFMLKQVVQAGMKLQGLYVDEVSSVSLHAAVWWLRRLAVCVCVVLLGWTAVSYRDLHMINHSLLENVAREQRQLRRMYTYIMTAKSTDISPERRHGRYTRDTVDSVTPIPSDSVRPRRPLPQVTSPERNDADDEGDGGRDDASVISGSTVSTIAKSRYNLRSSSVMANASLREMTPASSVASRSSSRSRISSTPTKARLRDLNSSRLSEFNDDGSSDIQMLADVESSARRTARSARLARVAAQRQQENLP